MISTLGLSLLRVLKALGVAAALTSFLLHLSENLGREQVVLHAKVSLHLLKRLDSDKYTCMLLF